uniref:Ig-like domain-containing protein n=1 Tax=Sinocyclocheilus anshuiensis TaxID=1608454 RepID=A0A671SVQ3_9TELE
MTRENDNTPETSFEDSSGSSSFIETHFSDNVINPSTTAEFFSFPSFRELSTTTQSMGVSHTLSAPPTMRTELRQDNGQNNLSDIKVLAGKTVHLECRTDGRPVPMVSWILTNHTEVKLITEHGRVSVTTMGTLTIQEVSVLDSGHYKCIASNPAGTDTATARLQVVAAPPVILEEKQQLVSADIGQNLFLACSTYGDPQPTTYWVLHDGTIVRPLTYSHTKVSVFGNGTLYLRDLQITESGKYECIATILENGTLIIESVNEKDAGDFICVARNKVGDDVQLIRVSMSMKPARIKPNVFSRKKVNYGNDLKVDCVAAGVPMPEISWGLPDGTLVNSGLQADGAEGDQFKQYTVFNNGTLYLNKVGSDEEGDYTCYAENKLGKDKMHVHISVVTAVPRIQRPILSYAKVKPGRNVRFDCKAIGEPKPNVFWMLPSKDIIAASNDRYLVHANGSLDIRNVKLADAGEYVCMARNAAGEENKEYKLDIDGNPPIINGLNQNRTVLKDTAVKYTRKLIDYLNMQCSHYPFENSPGVKQPGLSQTNACDGPLGLASSVFLLTIYLYLSM